MSSIAPVSFTVQGLTISDLHDEAVKMLDSLIDDVTRDVIFSFTSVVPKDIVMVDGTTVRTNWEACVEASVIYEIGDYDDQ